jgi:hypothetical protein
VSTYRRFGTVSLSLLRRSCDGGGGEGPVLLLVSCGRRNRRDDENANPRKTYSAIGKNKTKGEQKRGSCAFSTLDGGNSSEVSWNRNFLSDPFVLVHHHQLLLLLSSSSLALFSRITKLVNDLVLTTSRLISYRSCSYSSFWKQRSVENWREVCLLLLAL